MNILIDTNILIPLEDSGKILDPRYANLKRMVSEHGFRILVHPAQLDDIERDDNIVRKKIMLSRINQYTLIANPPILTSYDLTRNRWTQSSDNDRVDNLLLHAVARGAAHILITEDHRIRMKAIRANLQERVYHLDQALNFLSKDHGLTSFRAPHGIRERFLYEFDVHSSFFDSLREGYNGFNDWYFDKARENRQCWCVAEESASEPQAICIFKNEDGPVVTDDGRRLLGRVLKLCTIKVAESIRGKKIGERILFTAFRYAEAHDIDWVYVHTDPNIHGHLIALCMDYGFVCIGDYKRDVVFAKPMRPGLHEEPESSLAFAIQYYPHFRANPPVKSYLVPIQPQYHENLFPDISNMANGLFADVTSMYGPQSNSIKKAYICRSNVGTITSGDLLFFYRTHDRKSVQVVAVVESVTRTKDLDFAFSLVAKRTVFTRDQLARLLQEGDGAALIILFRLMRFLDSPVSEETLLNAGVVGPYQSIRNIDADIIFRRGV